MSFNRLFYGFWIFCGVVVLALLPFGLGQNFTTHFDREVPLKQSETEALDALLQTKRWPEWFFHLKEVKNLTSGGHSFRQGDQLELLIDPNKGPWRKFSLFLRVEAFDPTSPKKGVIFKVERDSKQKLEKLLTDIRWSISIKDQKLFGTASAQTSSFKGRLFGRITETILMAQVFYPNLIKLADPAAKTTGLSLQGPGT